MSILTNQNSNKSFEEHQKIKKKQKTVNKARDPSKTKNNI